MAKDEREHRDNEGELLQERDEATPDLAELYRTGYSSPRSAVVRLFRMLTEKKQTVTIYPKDGGTQTYNVQAEARRARREKTGLLNLLLQLRVPQRRGHSNT